MRAAPATVARSSALLVTVVVVAIRMEPRSSRRQAASHDAGDRALRRAATRRFAVPLVVAAMGIALILAATGTVRILGWGVLAIAITLAISLVFLEVGYNEDRARARHRRSARRAASEDRGRGTPRGIRG